MNFILRKIIESAIIKLIPNIIGAISNKIFKKKKNKKKSHTPKKIYAQKFGIVVCHDEKDQGAENKKTKMTEYLYCMNLVQKLRDRIPKLYYTTRDKGGISAAYNRCGLNDITITIEPHLNSYNSKVEGTECLIIDGDEESEKVARKYLELITLHFPSQKIRGVKKLKRGDDGHYNLRCAKSNGVRMAILTESFFLDNDNDWKDPDKLKEVFIDLMKEKFH